MTSNIFGLKELYDCVFKTTYDLKIGDREFIAGEPIAVFDTLSLANFEEHKVRNMARGGYANQPRIFWESTEQVRINFSQGVFSKLHLALLGNAYVKDKELILVPIREKLETDENLQVQLKYNPQDLFIYDEYGNKISTYDIENNILTFQGIEPYTSLEIFYNYLYQDAYIITIGRRLLSGYLDMTAKTRLKDDITGKIVTGVLHAPKVQLMSDFSIRLGSDAPPATGYFELVAFPTGSKGSEIVMEFISLNDDIDSDI